MAAKKQKHTRKRSHSQQIKQSKDIVSSPTENRSLLSIGMIFRDDIRCIERCLQALQPLREAVPCQLVMADTGSVDGSRAVADRYADCLIDFPWIGDFSAARNAVMDRCTGYWYLTVDTDEYLDSDFSELVEFLTDWNNLRKYEYAYVTILNYPSFEMYKGEEAEFYGGRLLRMDTGYRYCNTIHECWPLKSTDRGKELLRVVFHHDGYGATNWAKKRKRNLPLLREAMEREPGNPIRLLQYLESEPDAKDTRKYSVRAMELSKQWIEQTKYHDQNMVDVVNALVVLAVQKAHQYGYPEFEYWVDLTRKWFPDSMRVSLDVSFWLAGYYLKYHRAEDALKALNEYQKTMSRYLSRDFDHRELRKSPYRSTENHLQQRAVFYKVRAYLILEDWSSVCHELSLVQLNQIKNMALIQEFVSCLMRLWQESDMNPADILYQSVQNLLGDTESRFARQRRETFFSTCRNAFQKQEFFDNKVRRPAHELFICLGETHDLGRAALILGTENTEEIHRFLDMVEDWRFFPTEAIDHALKAGAQLPEHFFHNKSEVLSYHADKLYHLRKDEPLDLLRLWVREINASATPGQVLWLYSLTSVVIQSVDWKTEGDHALFDIFCECVDRYMKLFLAPAACTEEYIELQPAITRFAWYCIQGKKCRDVGREVEYIRWLKKALLSDPDRKEMIQFLSQDIQDKVNEPPETECVPKELMELAEKVKAILSTFSHNDPAVLAIKQSEAYQKVAYLLS